jgi:hypothetical protein
VVQRGLTSFASKRTVLRLQALPTFSLPICVRGRRTYVLCASSAVHRNTGSQHILRGLCDKTRADKGKSDASNPKEDATNPKEDASNSKEDASNPKEDTTTSSEGDGSAGKENDERPLTREEWVRIHIHIDARMMQHDSRAHMLFCTGCNDRSYRCDCWDSRTGGVFWLVYCQGAVPWKDERKLHFQQGDRRVQTALTGAPIYDS